MKAIILMIIGLSLFAAADSRFVRNTNGIVTDNSTGLQCQDDYNENGDITKHAIWVDAIVYCEALDLGGNNDWRLPNYNELYYLSDRSTFRPAIDTTVFQNTISNRYWSSTSIADKEDWVWGGRF